jgi:hypothetical protein
MAEVEPSARPVASGCHKGGPASVECMYDKSALVESGRAQRRAPDHHHDSTAENLGSICYASEGLQRFRKERVPVAEIDACLLFDDPDDVDGDLKIELIRSTIHSDIPLPAVVIVHHCPLKRPGRPPGPYHVLEGKHRYNAAYRERTPQLYAWVAPIGCCGGPIADLSET